jgi:membrane protein
VSFIATIWVSSGALSAAMNALDQIHEIPMAQRRPFWKAKLMSIVITLGAVALLIFASFLVLVGDSMVKIGSDLVVRLPVDTTGIYVLVTLWKLLSYPLALALGAGMLAMISNILMRPADRRYPLRKLKKLTIWIAISTSSLIGLCFLIVFIQNLIINLKIDYDIANLLVILWRFLSLPLALAIVSIAFAFIYSVGSSRIITGMPVLPGAILGAISWGIISSLFRLYVSNFGQYNRVYGAVGTAIILMLWLQLSALVMLIGDQLNAVIHDAMLEDAHQQTDADFTSPGTREVNIDSIMEANLDEYKNPPLTEEA